MDMPKAIYPFNFFKVGGIMRFCFLLYKHPANAQASLHTHTLVRVIAACMHQVRKKRRLRPKFSPIVLLDNCTPRSKGCLYVSQISTTVKPVLSGHSKIGKTMILMANGSLMKVESIAECSIL